MVDGIGKISTVKSTKVQDIPFFFLFKNDSNACSLHTTQAYINVQLEERSLTSKRLCAVHIYAFCVAVDYSQELPEMTIYTEMPF